MKKQTKNMIWGILIVLLGVFFGYAAVWVGTLISEGGQWLPFLNSAKALTGNLTLAVFAGTLIAYYSRTPKEAGIRVLLFTFGMLAGYYITSGVTVGFLPMYYLIRWCIYAVLSALAGYLIWHSKKSGWPAAVYAALPIGYLLSRGYRIYTGYAIEYVIVLVLAVILFILMPMQKGQRLRVLPLAILFAVIIIWFDEIIKFMGL